MFDELTTEELQDLYDEMEKENNVGALEEIQHELDQRAGL